MKQTGFRRVLCIAVLVLMLLSTLLVPVTAGGQVSFDSSPVETDLETLLGKDEKNKLILDETVRTEDGGQFVSVVYVLEHGYDALATDWSHYGLYIYVYNPSGKPLRSSTRNRVEMQVGTRDGTRTAIVKYPLQLCSYSPDYVLYKYKVGGMSVALLSQLKPAERSYFISGIEFLFDGQSNPKDFDVSGSYHFTGFNAGFDGARSAFDTLSLRYDRLETISVELHPTSWMSQTSDKGEGYKYEVSGVYFAIPNYYLKTFGNWDDELRGLYAVEGSYYENKINGIVTDNTEVYNNAKAVAGKNIEWYGYSMADHDARDGLTCREDFPLHFGVDFARTLNPDIDPLLEYDFSYNISVYVPFSVGISTKVWISKKAIYKICIPFYAESADVISKDTVMQALTEYPSEISSDGIDYRLGTADADRTAGYHTYCVTADDPPMGFTSLDYSQEHPFWAWWHRFSDANYGDQQAKVEWLQRVDMDVLDAVGATETMNVANKYYIGESDVSGLRKLANSNAVQNGLLKGIAGSTVYLMHFAKTDFYAKSVDVYDNAMENGGVGNKVSGNHYYYERTVFEDFDILQFTFRDKNDELTVVPVIASPVNVTGGLPAPGDPDGNPSNPGIKDPGLTDAGKGCMETFNSLNGWGKFIALALGVVVLVFLLGFLKPVLNLFGGLIGGVFKGIGSVFRGGVNAIGTVFTAREKSYDAKRKRTKDQQSDADRERKQKNEDADRATTAADRERKQRYEDADRATAAADRERRQKYEDADRRAAKKERKRRQEREDEARGIKPKGSKKKKKFEPTLGNSFDADDFFEAALARSMREMAKVNGEDQNDETTKKKGE